MNSSYELELLLDDDGGGGGCTPGRRTNSIVTGRADSRIIVITASFGLPTTFTPPTLYIASLMAILPECCVATRHRLLRL